MSTLTRSGRFQPTVDFDLNAFDTEGRQTVFAISPFGASETREERLDRLQAIGSYDPGCPYCAAVRDHPRFDPFMPSHKASEWCLSGKRNHCTCDACF